MSNKVIYLLFVILYSLPHLLTFWMRVVSYPIETNYKIASLAFLFIVLVGAVRHKLRQSSKRVSYGYPITILLSSLLLISIASILVSAVRSGLDGLPSVFPVILVILIMAVALSIIPILFPFIVIFISNRKRKADSVNDDLLDSEFVEKQFDN